MTVPLDPFDLADGGKRILGCNYGNRKTHLFGEERAAFVAGDELLVVAIPVSGLTGPTVPPLALTGARIAYPGASAGPPLPRS